MNEEEHGGTRTAWRTLLCRWRLTSHNPVYGPELAPCANLQSRTFIAIKVMSSGWRCSRK
jgi:hypothetical protein